MALIADKGRMYFIEQNVDIPGVMRPSSVYDLGLFGELGNAGRAVLVVTVICRLKFADGKNLAWSGTEKADFTAGLTAALMDGWSEKHVLRTVTPTILAYDQIGVVFDIRCTEGLARTDHSHWNVEVTKIPPAANVVSKTGDPRFAGILNGSVELDSNDLLDTNKGGPQKQRPAVHEFGHMMGYLDEYLNSSGKPEGIPYWTTDLVGVMNLGQTVQPRHYIWFADWCNKKCTTIGALSKKPIEWKVNGAVNMATAQV